MAAVSEGSRDAARVSRVDGAHRKKPAQMERLRARVELNMLSHKQPGTLQRS